MYRLINDESCQDKSTVTCKDSETMEGEVKRSNKVGKCRSRNSKADCSPDYGADADGDQQGQGVPSSREERVSSLKTVSEFKFFGLFICFLDLNNAFFLCFVYVSVT